MDEKIEFISSPSEYRMAEEWYEFATYDHFWMNWRFEILRNILPGDFCWGRTLEIGCGNGTARKQSEDHFGCTINGCDLNLAALRMAPPGRGKLYFYNIHERHPEFKGLFDTLLLLDVLEHIEAPLAFLESVGFHLKTGGTLIVNVPAVQAFYGLYDRIAGHAKRYNLNLLKKELQVKGFRIERSTYWGMSLLPFLLIRKLILPFYSRKRIIQNGFQPGSPLIDSVLKSFMRIECTILPKPPVGTSLMAITRKA